MIAKKIPLKVYLIMFDVFLLVFTLCQFYERSIVIPTFFIAFTALMIPNSFKEIKNKTWLVVWIILTFILFLFMLSSFF